MSYQFFDMLRTRLVERIAEATESVANGTAADFADYKGRCQHIAGLREALGHAEDVNKQLTGG
jgi:hypothetical protein